MKKYCQISFYQKAVCPAPLEAPDLYRNEITDKQNNSDHGDIDVIIDLMNDTDQFGTYFYIYLQPNK